MTAEERWAEPRLLRPLAPAVVQAMDSLSVTVTGHPRVGYRLTLVLNGVSHVVGRRYRTRVGARLAMVRVLSGGQP